MGKYYIWFVVIVAGLAGAIRLVLPRRFAELQLERFRAANAIAKAKIRSVIFLAVGLVFGGIYFVPWGHQIWIIIGTTRPTPNSVSFSNAHSMRSNLKMER